MVEEIAPVKRYERISLPKGMQVFWYGAGRQQTSRVRTLGMGGMFISESIPLAIGTNLKLVFQVPAASSRRMLW